jgi:hypothetical protein
MGFDKVSGVNPARPNEGKDNKGQTEKQSSWDESAPTEKVMS